MNRMILMSKISFNRLIEVVSERIKQMPGCVVLRKDISDIGTPSQISHALQVLIKRFELVRMGQGIYAKAYYSDLLKKSIIQDGFDAACLEALDRLGVACEPSQWEKAYN